MACACKVNQQIDKIQKYYAYNGKNRDENKARLSINKADAAKTMLIYAMLLPIMPLVFVGTACYSIFSKKKLISLRKFLGFIHKTRNGRK